MSTPLQMSCTQTGAMQNIYSDLHRNNENKSMLRCVIIVFIKEKKTQNLVYLYSLHRSQRTDDVNVETKSTKSRY